VTALKHPLFSQDLSPLDFFLLLTKNNLKAQTFASAEEVTAKATRSLTEPQENGFQEYYQKIYER
jgi:hypothetical protein